MNNRGKIGNIYIGEKPEKPSFSIKYVDNSYDPMENFYMYSYGNWVAHNNIPEDKFMWGADIELIEWNKYILGKILESCAINNDNENAIEKSLGNFYISIMDIKTIENARFKPVKGIMEKIDGIYNKNDIISISAYLHSIGINVLFSFESSPDERNSSIYAYYLNQGGLSLPNRDYYLEDSFIDIRKHYLQHIKNVFHLYGLNDEQSDQATHNVLNIETDMALKSRKPVDLRDPENNYNRFEFNNILNEFQGLYFKLYFSEAGISNADYIIVGQPEFFYNLEKLIEKYSIEQWKIYLKWKTLNFASPYLYSGAENEFFDFFRKKLLGQEKQEKRWKKAVDIIDNLMGEALGELYVKQEFSEESKRRMDDMVNDLREVFVERINKLTWMGKKTREKALEKFSKFRAKIGFPSKFIDYSSIEIDMNDFFGNVIRCNKFEFEREIKRIGRLVDKELWEMTPQTVNAYFSPTDNEIVFPAGILQPPFFDVTMDDAVNYGAIGGTIAHEMTHGYDDEGRKFDLNGNINDWWTQEDNKAFMEKAKSVIELYNSLEALPGIYVNGELTLGENIADIGGVSIAFEALERRLNKNPEMRKLKDNFTPEQRFFISWAQSWRLIIKDEALKWQIYNDVHSPEKFRAEIPVYVHEKFEDTFKSITKIHDRKFQKINMW